MPDFINNSRYRVGNTFVSRTNVKNTIKIIEDSIRSQKKIQVCVSDFQAVCFANKTPEYRLIVENAELNNPDGIPLIWLARVWGLGDVEQTMGPEVFITMLKDAESGFRHFLLGDTDEVLEEIKNKYVNSFSSKIVGTFSPPFIDVESYDYLKIAELVNKSNADIVWISLTSPKQDFFGVRLLPLLQKATVIGVGAAFRYSIGKYSMPKGFKHKIGLAGFMRKDNFWGDLKWYLKNTIQLVIFAINIITRRIKGIQFYE